MRIGIDARLYTQTGVGRYLKNILRALQKLDVSDEYIVYFRKKDWDLFQPVSRHWHKKLLDISWHTITEQIVVPYVLLRDHLDVVHFPYFNVPISYPKKYLLTIHDLILDHFDTGRASTLPKPLYRIKRLGYSFATKLAVRRASAITVISNTTKAEVYDHYHVPSEKLFVTYDALDTHFQKTVDTETPVRLFPNKYILYVGNAYPHKNLERLLQALKIVRKHSLIKLVCAGSDFYFYPRLERYAKSLGLGDAVIFFGNANDHDLFNLYSFCSFLVFPSLMEGFGLPNLEALYCNILPVISDIPVFREIWGEKLPMFNPYSSTDIAGKMVEILKMSPAKYKQLVSRAKKNLPFYDWEKTAKITRSLYETMYTTQ
ncbi:glycosyltransferase family 4 protein [Candidatus Gottesmanbacteria bacterium]|nr:glycosyltransferase family 4 protein [Candidatus Gottesmanbacteria bacterium]